MPHEPPVRKITLSLRSKLFMGSPKSQVERHKHREHESGGDPVIAKAAPARVAAQRFAPALPNKGSRLGLEWFRKEKARGDHDEQAGHEEHERDEHEVAP